jgi:protein-L-isoaspartate(D-aspartate) O-methyltransferase
MMSQMEVNVEQARFNMIEQQIRTWEVLDGTVLDLLKKIPRENFVQAQYAGLAFADMEIPIGDGELMLAPKMEARILQALNLKRSDKVLEIGTGSGYLTALLASLSGHVTSVEIKPSLSAIAKIRIDAHHLTNVDCIVGDASAGWAQGAPYDVIVYTGSLPEAPESVAQQLAIGGRMFAVVGEAPVMQAMMTQRVSESGFKQEVLFETCIPPLINAPQPERFEF